MLLFLFPPYHTVYAQREEPTTDTSTGEELTPDLTQQQQQQGLAGQKHQQPAVILTFDDNYRGQYEHAKPIMERYGANGTFFVSCMAGFTMTWDQVRDLYNSGFDIQSHGLIHADLTKVPLSEAENEIHFSKNCIEANVPGLNITIFANPYGRGGNIKSLVDFVAKDYAFARAGFSETTYLGCDGWYAKEYNEAPDCSVTNPNGTLKYAHKYQMFGTSHNGLDSAHRHNTALILEDFKSLLHRTTTFNDDDGTIRSLPIITYHNIANLNETERRLWNSTTTPETFLAEVQYMHDNGIRMLSMADLQFDNSTQRFHIRQ